MTDQEFWLSVMGMVAVFIFAIWLIYWVYRTKVLEREERRLMIERGMVPPEPRAHVTTWPAVKAREQELRFEERRLLIEKGLQPGAENAANILTELMPKTEERPEDYLRRGLVKLVFGLGLAGAYVVFNSSGVDASNEARNWFLFFAVISPAIALWGVANIVYYGATRNTRRQAEVSARDRVR